MLKKKDLLFRFYTIGPNLPCQTHPRLNMLNRKFLRHVQAKHERTFSFFSEIRTQKTRLFFWTISPRYNAPLKGRAQRSPASNEIKTSAKVSKTDTLMNFKKNYVENPLLQGLTAVSCGDILKNKH